MVQIVTQAVVVVVVGRIAAKPETERDNSPQDGLVSEAMGCNAECAKTQVDPEGHKACLSSKTG